ncbi:MAG: hypothetical protein IKF19_01715 [Bacilli bacterium]|nr:hypothetical protein [Bacilli bacterium]
MNYSELEDKLRELSIEDFIWVIYIGIIILSWYANDLERDFFINNNLNSKNKYREVMIVIFSILIVVYYYFLKDSYDSLMNININDSEDKKNLIYLSFIASLFIFISGLIFIYIAVKDKNMDVELAFN